jgi:hypothetical protein
MKHSACYFFDAEWVLHAAFARRSTKTIPGLARKRVFGKYARVGNRMMPILNSSFIG